MNTDALYALAAEGDREGFEKQLAKLISAECINQFKPCLRNSYSGLVRPRALKKLAGSASLSCFYELTNDACVFRSK